MLRRLFIGLSVLLLMPTMLVAARDFRSGDLCNIPEDETINGTLFVFCEELVIQGIVNGDVIGATVRSNIEGVVDGSLYLVGGQLDVTGIVRQDVHYGGAVLRLNPPISETTGNDARTIRSLKALTLSSTLYEQTTIDDGILNLGYQLIMHGDVNDEVSFWGSTLVVNGVVDGNTYAIVGDPNSDSSQIETLLLPLDLDLALLNPGLTIGNSGEIAGQLSYTGPQEGRISGDLRFAPIYEPTPTFVPTLDEPGTLALYLETFGREFATLIIIGILILFFANSLLNLPLGNLRTRPFASLAVGLLGFLLSFPIVLIILVLSLSLLGFLFIVGLRAVVVPIALVLGLVNVGGVSLFYFVAIFVARSLVGLAIGRLILRVGFNRHDVDEHRWLQYLALVIGVAVVSFTMALPIIGIILNAITLFLGLGAILLVLMTQLQRARASAPTVAPAWYAPSPAILRQRRLQSGEKIEKVPLPDDAKQLPAAPVMPVMNTDYEDDEETVIPVRKYGVHNLPDGFDFSFFDD